MHSLISSIHPRFPSFYFSPLSPLLLFPSDPSGRLPHPSGTPAGCHRLVPFRILEKVSYSLQHDLNSGPTHAAERRHTPPSDPAACRSPHSKETARHCPLPPPSTQPANMAEDAAAVARDHEAVRALIDELLGLENDRDMNQGIVDSFDTLTSDPDAYRDEKREANRNLEAVLKKIRRKTQEKAALEQRIRHSKDKSKIKSRQQPASASNASGSKMDIWSSPSNAWPTASGWGQCSCLSFPCGFVFIGQVQAHSFIPSLCHPVSNPSFSTMPRSVLVAAHHLHDSFPARRCPFVQELTSHSCSL